MNEKNLQLQEAEVLFEEGKYYEAGKSALNLIKDEVCLTQSFLLYTKSYLFLVDDPKDESKMQAFFDAIGKTMGTVQSISEYDNARYEIEVAYNDWKAKILKKNIIELESQATLKEWGIFINIPTALISNWVRAMICMKSSVNQDVLMQKSDDHIEDLKIPNKLSNSDWHPWIFDAACRIFKNAKDVLRREQHSSADHCEKLSSFIVEKFLLAEIMVEYCIPNIDKRQKIDDATKEIYLKKLAEIKDTLLRAMLYPNGTPMSLYLGNREKTQKELIDTYKKIKSLNPDFVASDLPNIEAVKLPTGGCYVATAVYGSYDCPQVWTLRRYRDMVIAKRFWGRVFIHCYYFVSPSLVRWFGHTVWFKNMFKKYLDKKVIELNDKGFKNTRYQDMKW